ncbi:MAG: helix-turn-helix domain-containing protein, partial [Deferrisomatales bacterium]
MGWSQTTLDARAGVSAVKVSLWETGEESPSPERLARLETILGEGAWRIAREAVPLHPPEPPAPSTEPSCGGSPRWVSADAASAARKGSHVAARRRPPPPAELPPLLDQGQHLPELVGAGLDQELVDRHLGRGDH